MQESAGYERGLDIACGDMETRPSFQTKSYLGTDADAARLAAAKERTGEDGIVCRIQDMPREIKGDFVLCLQTIGFNKDFHVQDSLFCVEKCAAATSPRGMLLINIGHEAREHFKEIEGLLKTKFNKVDSRHYGRGRNLRQESASYLAACCMWLFPLLARSNSAPCRLLICRHRLETETHPKH